MQVLRCGWEEAGRGGVGGWIGKRAARVRESAAGWASASQAGSRSPSQMPRAITAAWDPAVSAGAKVVTCGGRPPDSQCWIEGRTAADKAGIGLL